MNNDSNKLPIIAYYTGDSDEINKYPVEKLTHIIYSFLHLKGNRLTVDNENDSITLVHLSSLKNEYPGLKVLISLGGWGGCKSCSDVFSGGSGRKEFAISVKEILTNYNLDGIDLDWEYPAIAGFPGHRHAPEDKENFTFLMQELRTSLGEDYEISFAAGGFSYFINESIEWNKVIPLIDRVNIMTYDFVHGYSTKTGHHTPLYSNEKQIESTDHAVKLLSEKGVPLNMMVIGAAFYGRIWENVPDVNHGIYQDGRFKQGVNYKKLDEYVKNNSGFEFYWDSTSQAPYMYNPEKQFFLTYDDSLSVSKKTRYVIENKLGGIMFWELKGDYYEGGLLDAIHSVVNK
ncbi:glycoside hydrolase family 18 protein [candidate division KSB1 bacterium]